MDRLLTAYQVDIFSSPVMIFIYAFNHLVSVYHLRSGSSPGINTVATLLSLFNLWNALFLATNATTGVRCSAYIGASVTLWIGFLLCPPSSSEQVPIFLGMVFPWLTVGFFGMLMIGKGVSLI